MGFIVPYTYSTNVNWIGDKIRDVNFRHFFFLYIICVPNSHVSRRKCFFLSNFYYCGARDNIDFLSAKRTLIMSKRYIYCEGIAQRNKEYQKVAGKNRKNRWPYQIIMEQTFLCDPVNFYSSFLFFFFFFENFAWYYLCRLDSVTRIFV